MPQETPNTGLDPSALDFDPEALRAKYQEERARRLRPDGNNQYREVAGELSRYLEDPYAEPIERDPIKAQMDVLIIGGGFGGQLMAARLQRAGVQDFRIVEKAGDFGGTWYWNRYPGVQCDIESYIYLPLLEELGYMPTEKYVSGAEILEHSRAIGRHYDLYRRTYFQTEVVDLRWNETLARWVATTQRGDEFQARFVCMSTGPLHKPKLPGVRGVETFQGHSFHTSRWDYAYTGGDHTGGLTGLADKRVGIIGTGATAIQCIPHLGAHARHLYVFQRTPSSVDLRNNRPTDPAWAAMLPPGWQKHRRENFNLMLSGVPQDEDLVSDGWTDIIRNLGRQAAGGDAEERRQLADFQKMEQIRRRVDQIVKDPATAEALKPYYNQMCKRPCFNDAYLPTFNRPNVTLVDTRGKGVDEITPTGVIVDGVEYEVDCLIYATGFEVGTDYSRRSGYEIYGRGGISQSEAWRDGVSSFMGIFSRGFPNRFILGNAQQANTANFTHMLDEVSTFLARLIRTSLDRGVVMVEPAADAERDWVEHCLSFVEQRRAFDEACTPGYYNNEGQPSDLATRNTFYGGGSVRYLELLSGCEARDFAGLELTRQADYAEA